VAWARTLPADVIELDPDQPRRTLDEAALVELAESIRTQGVLQPILVRRDPDRPGRYVVVAGERRLRAARIAGLGTVPVMVLAGESLREARIAQLTENLQREDLPPMEEALAVVSLAEAHELSQEELARRLAKSPAYVSRIFTVSRIPAAEYGELATFKPSLGVLYEYAQLPTDPALRRAAREAIRSGATVRDLEAMRGRQHRARKTQVKLGRPRKAAAPLRLLTRAAREVTALDPTRAAGLGAREREQALVDIVALVRWAGELAGDEAVCLAAAELERRLRARGQGDRTQDDPA
jgi:ParB family chromosome partitioning protein